MKKLIPFTGSINFRPSYKQWKVWEMLEPNRCDKCGGQLEMRVVGQDAQGNIIKKPFCKDCQTSDIPRLILYGGAAGAGKSHLGCAWVVSTCLRFPGARMVIARKVLKILKGTTWVTLMRILKDFGLKEGVHFHCNNVESIITFWNDSKILCFGLEDKPSDQTFSWLGSYEITGAYVDEASEVSEKAIEVLLSRCRWMIAETFIVPKVLMGTNPAICWLREAFVQDENGNPLEHLPSGYRFVPATVWENPDPLFVQTYAANLMNIRDPYTRNRLLHGLWSDPEGNPNSCYHSFNSVTHVKTGLRELVYNKLKPLILSFDFNILPYSTCIIGQIDYDHKKVYIIDEILGRPKDKLNNTPAFSKMISDSLVARGHLGGVLITGDPAGLSRTTITEEGVNNYTVIKKYMDEDVLRPQVQLLSKQPAHTTRLDFINQLFEGNVDGWEIQIDFRCHKLIEDLLRQRRNEDGTKCKHLGFTSDGLKCELLGHCSDAFDYMLVYYLGRMYSKFKAKTQVSPIVTIGPNEHAYSVQSDWDY